MSRNVNLNLASACQYINTLSVKSLDGLYWALTDKMAELGVEANRRAVPDVDLVEAVTGNMRSIGDWIDSLAVPVDVNAVGREEAAAQKKEHVPNERAAKQYEHDCRRFEQEKKDLQALHALVTRRFGGKVPERVAVEEEA